MRTCIFLLSIIISFMAACTLKRDNPLDPIGNPEIRVPETISNLTCTPSPAGTSNKYVELRWNANSPLNTDGYYVYRSLSYFNQYTIVDTVQTNSCTHGSKPWHNIFPGTYWYKVSAYKYYSVPQPLEGRLSEARPVIVPN